jgi:hypothetical protein
MQRCVSLSAEQAATIDRHSIKSFGFGACRIKAAMYLV